MYKKKLAQAAFGVGVKYLKDNPEKVAQAKKAAIHAGAKIGTEYVKRNPEQAVKTAHRVVKDAFKVADADPSRTGTSAKPTSPTAPNKTASTPAASEEEPAAAKQPVCSPANLSSSEPVNIAQNNLDDNLSTSPASNQKRAREFVMAGVMAGAAAFIAVRLLRWAVNR